MKKGLSQEGLKLIACVLMLLDHVAAALVAQPSLYLFLRGLGRAAFPIFCFLLAEGAHYTSHPRRYMLRMLLGALLSEYPFDLAIFGGFTWLHQSVMVTLLLGLGAIFTTRKMENPWLKILVVLPFVLGGELLRTDYGWHGVALMVLLGVFREHPHRRAAQLLSIVLMCALIPSFPVSVLGIPVPIEMFGVLALIPVSLYRGEKRYGGKWLQWGFYLFYPVHLLIIGLIAH